jgi:hypothetical protein
MIYQDNALIVRNIAMKTIMFVEIVYRGSSMICSRCIVSINSINVGKHEIGEKA